MGTESAKPEDRDNESSGASVRAVEVSLLPISGYLGPSMEERIREAERKHLGGSWGKARRRLEDWPRHRSA